MSFATRNTAMKTMTAACLAHAEKNGWNVHFNIAERQNYWKDAAWWPDMANFIMRYKVDKEMINQWGLFDKMDTGITVSAPSQSDLLFKQHTIAYLRSERLR